MSEIKELSDYLKAQLPAEFRINLKEQAERLSKESPEFNYRRLLKVRSEKSRHKEQGREVALFKKVFAKELEGYDDAPRTKEEIEDYDRRVEKLEKEINELEEYIKTLDTEKEDVQKALNEANAIIRDLLKKMGIVGPI